MSRTKFEETIARPEVKQMLETLEDKVLSSSRVTRLAGNNEADFTLRYAWTTDNTGSEGAYLLIEVDGASVSSPSEEEAEALRDFISEKMEDLLESTGGEIQDVLENIDGECVLVNGVQIY